MISDESVTAKPDLSIHELGLDSSALARAPSPPADIHLSPSTPEPETGRSVLTDLTVVRGTQLRKIHSLRSLHSLSGKIKRTAQNERARRRNGVAPFIRISTIHSIINAWMTPFCLEGSHRIRCFFLATRALPLFRRNSNLPQLHTSNNSDRNASRCRVRASRRPHTVGIRPHGRSRRQSVRNPLTS